MKTRIHITQFCLLATIAVLQACAQADEPGTAAVSPRFTADIGGAATRAVNQTWNADRIGVMVTDAPNSDMETIYTNVPYSTSSTGTEASFTPVSEDIYFQDGYEAVTFAAYAPYQETAGDITVGDTKAANATAAGQEKIDFLFATATGSSYLPEVNFSFRHIMSKLVLKFKVGEGLQAYDDLTGNAAYSLVGISHSGTVNLTPGSAGFGTATATASASMDEWDITDCVHEDDEANKSRTYTLYLLPQDLSASGITIFLDIDGESFTATVSPDLEAGEETAYTIALKGEELAVEGCTVSDWTANGTEGGNQSVGLTNVVNLASVTGNLTVTGNTIFTGTSANAVTININEGASDVIFQNATFAGNTQIRVNTTATIHLMGTNTMTASSREITPITVAGGTEDTPHTLTITGSDTDTLDIKTTEGYSTCIKNYEAYSHIVISGGNISVSTEGNYSAAIGGGFAVSSGNITITGGTVTAVTSGDYSSAIGGGWHGTSGNITISGGTVKATATGDDSVAIGAGDGGRVGNITITGGEVIAESSAYYTVAIGCTQSGIYGDILISGSKTKVTATSPANRCRYDIGTEGTIYIDECGTITIADGATVQRNDGSAVRYPGN